MLTPRLRIGWIPTVALSTWLIAAPIPIAISSTALIVAAPSESRTVYSTSIARPPSNAYDRIRVQSVNTIKRGWFETGRSGQTSVVSTYTFERSGRPDITLRESGHGEEMVIAVDGRTHRRPFDDTAEAARSYAEWWRAEVSEVDPDVLAPEIDYAIRATHYHSDMNYRSSVPTFNGPGRFTMAQPSWSGSFMRPNGPIIAAILGGAALLWVAGMVPIIVWQRRLRVPAARPATIEEQPEPALD